MGLLNHKVVVFLISWETSTFFSIVAVPIYIPTNSVEGFWFFFFPLHPCQHLFLSVCLFVCLINICLNRYEVITYCGLICISLISGFEYFSCTCWSLVCLLWENVYSDPLSFLIFFFFLQLSLLVSYIFWIPSQIFVLQIFYFIP